MAANSTPFSTTSPWGSTRPRQKVTSSQKTPQWKKDNVLYWTSMGYQELSTGRNSKMEKQLNYNLKNSIIDPAQFEYVTDSLGLGSEFGGNPAQLTMKNLIGPKIDRLSSEEMLRPFNWMVRGIGGEVLTERQEEKRRLLGEYLQAMYQNVQQGGQGSEQELAQQGIKLPPSIEKYMRSEYLDPREVTANQILEYLIKADKLPQKFNTLFTDALITSEEYGFVSIRKGHPSFRPANPLNCRFPHNQDEQWVHRLDWGVEEQWLMPSQVLDLYGEFLDEQTLGDLDEGTLGAYFQGGSQGMSPFVDLYSPAINALRPPGAVLVQTCAWRGWERVGFFSYPDPKTGEWQKVEVDDTFTIPKELSLSGATLEWEWQEQIWQGTRIGRETIVDVRPLDFQLGYLPWIGFIHNNRNSKATSLVDLVKEDQFSYMIVWWKLEMEIAKYKGSRMLYDVAMLPTTGPNAMSMNQFLYYGETIGIQFYNSQAQVAGGRPLNQGGNMMQEVNLSNNGGWIQALLGVLAQLEARIDALTGVSRQREGDIRASESATGVQQAVSNSSMVTEPWFYNHNLLKGEVLTCLVEVAKVAYADGTTLPLVVDEVYQTLLKVDGDTFPDSHYGVFLTNSSKDWAELQEVKQYFMAGVQKGLLPMSSIAKAIKAKSPEQMVAAMQEGEQTMQANQQTQQEAQSKAQAQQAQAQQAHEQRQWDNENTQKQLDRENKIQVATISALKGGKDGPADSDGDGIVDPIEQAELSLKVSAHQASVVAQQQKASADLQKAGLSHQATMKKLELETTKLSLEAQKANLQAAQFTREQNQQDHDKKLQVQAQQQEKDSKAQELRMREKELAQKKSEATLKAQLEKTKLLHSSLEAQKDRTHEKELATQKAKVEIQKVKLKPKPKPTSK